jgi:outer membrane protein TolC
MIKHYIYILSVLLLTAVAQASAQTLTRQEIAAMAEEENDLTGDSSETTDFNTLTSTKLDLNKDLKDQLIPVDSIVELAIHNNPGVKMQQALVESGEAQVRYAKSEWLRNIAFNFNNSYGNTTLFYNSNESATELQTQNLNTGYRAGININIPLYEFFGRQHRVNVYRSELTAKDEQRKNVELELARQVIYEYNYTIAAHKMMLISSENLQAALTHQAMADKEFSEGVIGIGESARITEFASKAKIEFETAKREFFNWYMQLETLLGVRLDSLVRKK